MRVVLVHRWHGTPESDWYPWLRKKLEDQGYEIVIPEMPNTHKPRIDEWVSHLKKVAGNLNRDTIFIGHSVGCQTILRYLEKSDAKARKVIMVAPWMNLTDAVMSGEEGPIAKPWIETPIDFEKVKNLSKFVAIFSDDDPYVPLSNSDIFKEKLGAEIVVQTTKGHFDEDAGCKELPILLDIVRGF